jgi:hypothetical protein
MCADTLHGLQIAVHQARKLCATVCMSWRLLRPDTHTLLKAGLRTRVVKVVL